MQFCLMRISNRDDLEDGREGPDFCDQKDIGTLKH